MAQKLYALFWQFFAPTRAYRAPFTTLASLLFPHPSLSHLAPLSPNDRPANPRTFAPSGCDHAYP